tara:strand:+ start:230 stop:826 length:597 start_codon:yes stop_codon:yes gene_type:complete
MKANLNLETIQIFLVFILPGLVSMRVYRLLMPAAKLDWANSLVEGLFYSCINLAIQLPLIVFIHAGNFKETHPVWYGFIGLFILIVGPVIWPIIYCKIVRSESFLKRLQLPYPTAWDYFFDKREEVFLLIHLKNDKIIGGFFGPDSYATSYPNEGDIYVQAVYKTDKNGLLNKPIEDTKGLLIRKDEYSYIELLNVPT